MKNLCSEGNIFAVPLSKDSWTVGVVARVYKSIMLAYYYSPAYNNPVDLCGVPELFPSEAVLVGQTSILGIKNESWKILGTQAPWERNLWSPPLFLRQPHNPSNPMAVKISDTDLDEIERFSITQELASTLHPDGVYGYVALEKYLKKLL